MQVGWLSTVSTSLSRSSRNGFSVISNSIIQWEHFHRHLNTSDVGRIIMDIEKKLEAVEGERN